MQDGWSAGALGSEPRRACFEDAGPHLGYTGCTRNAEGELPLLDNLWFEVVTVYLK